MKSVADLVMHRIVVPEYAGSTPVWLPKFWLKRLGEKSMVKTRLKKISRINSVGRVPLLQSGSRRFKSYIRDSGHDRRDASGASLAELRMVGTVKVKCPRGWSEGWSPSKLIFARRQVVWHSTFNREGAGSNPAGRTKVFLL